MSQQQRTLAVTRPTLHLIHQALVSHIDSLKMAATLVHNLNTEHLHHCVHLSSRILSLKRHKAQFKTRTIYNLPLTEAEWEIIDNALFTHIITLTITSPPTPETYQKIHNCQNVRAMVQLYCPYPIIFPKLDQNWFIHPILKENQHTNTSREKL